MRPRSLCRWLVKKNWRISTFSCNIFSQFVGNSDSNCCRSLSTCNSSTNWLIRFPPTKQFIRWPSQGVRWREKCTNVSRIQMDSVDVHLNGIELRSNRGSSLWFYYSSHFDGGIWISSITPEISGHTNWGHHQPDECRSICQFAARWMWYEQEGTKLLSSVLARARFVQIRPILNVIDAIFYIRRIFR